MGGDVTVLLFDERKISVIQTTTTLLSERNDSCPRKWGLRPREFQFNTLSVLHVGRARYGRRALCSARRQTSAW